MPGNETDFCVIFVCKGETTKGVSGSFGDNIEGNNNVNLSPASSQAETFDGESK